MVTMGNMLFEVLNSQVLGATHNGIFHEDLNSEEGCSYYTNRASNKALLHTLEAQSSIARESGGSLDSLYSKLSVFHVPKKQQRIPVIRDQEILAPGSCGDEFTRPLQDQFQSYSPENSQTVVTHLPDSHSLAQHPSTSQNSDPSSSLVSGGHQAGAPDKARMLQFNQVVLDESSTTTPTRGPVSSKPTKVSARVVRVSTSLPLPAVDLTPGEPMEAVVLERKKRKRTKACKNSQELESQRMAHIAVERNRRKQMNEHLTVLRALMPGSYIQRGDQASIIGGAIEFIKELEEILQSLQLQKHTRDYGDENFNSQPKTILGDFVQSPQLVLDTSHSCMRYTRGSSIYEPMKEVFAESKSLVANVEVTMLGSAARLKILAQKRPQQLLHTLATMDNLQLTIMHMNITTIEDTVLYSFNIEVGFECKIHSVNELAASIQKIFSLFAMHCEKTMS